MWTSQGNYYSWDIRLVSFLLISPRYTGYPDVTILLQIACGGVWTSQGHYYSWDIRLVSLLLSLLFLLMYYKKYHILR